MHYYVNMKVRGKIGGFGGKERGEEEEVKR